MMTLPVVELQAVEAELAGAIHGRLLRTPERRLKRALAAAWKAQGRAFLKRLATQRALFERQWVAWFRERITESDWGPLWDEAAEETLGLFIDPLAQEMSAAYSAALGQILSQFDGVTPSLASIQVSFAVDNPRAVAWLQEHAAETVNGLNETTRNQLRALLVKAAEEGWAYSRVAREITAKFVGFGGPVPHGYLQNRAELVAVTELNNAYGESQLIVGRALAAAGLTMEKRWLTTTNPCPLCVANKGDGWIPIEQVFASGAMRPTQHPACRCTVLYRHQEE